ncbi:MAG TPA: cyclic nucleotide-binding domain-containing protein [Saprospiraceae bacterium]|nr:cyclic nucleotide-binding domain-containing protein [Saprospiraceae bacterium]
MPTLFVHKLEAIQNKIKGKFISHWYNVITKHNDQMIEVLKQHIIKRLGNDLEHLDLVLSKFKQIETKRKEQLLSEGEVCKYVYFIAKGCLQVYVYDHEMNETTRDIVIEDHWCSELISFGSGKPATENIRTVESSQLLAIDRKSFQEMMETVPQFDKVYKQILEASYANSVYRINTFVSLSALERLKWLMENRPSLLTRVSSKLIASYLGINKDVFSRLKAKL